MADDDFFVMTLAHLKDNDYYVTGLSDAARIAIDVVDVIKKLEKDDKSREDLMKLINNTVLDLGKGCRSLSFQSIDDVPDILEEVAGDLCFILQSILKDCEALLAVLVQERNLNDPGTWLRRPLGQTARLKAMYKRILKIQKKRTEIFQHFYITRGSRQWISKFDFYEYEYSSLDHFKRKGYHVPGLSDAAKIAMDTVDAIRKVAVELDNCQQLIALSESIETWVCVVGKGCRNCTFTGPDEVPATLKEMIKSEDSGGTDLCSVLKSIKSECQALPEILKQESIRRLVNPGMWSTDSSKATKIKAMDVRCKETVMQIIDCILSTNEERRKAPRDQESDNESNPSDCSLGETLADLHRVHEHRKEESSEGSEIRQRTQLLRLLTGIGFKRVRGKCED